MSQPSISNEFTIPLVPARSIRLLKQEIETWKQRYEDVERKYEDATQGKSWI